MATPPGSRPRASADQWNPKGLGGAPSFGLRRRLAGTPHPVPATCAPHRCPHGAAAAATARAENPSDRGSRSACRRRRGCLYRMSGPLWTRGRAGHAPEARVPRGGEGWEEGDASSSPARVPGQDGQAVPGRVWPAESAPGNTTRRVLIGTRLEGRRTSFCPSPSFLTAPALPLPRPSILQRFTEAPREPSGSPSTRKCLCFAGIRPRR